MIDELRSMQITLFLYFYVNKLSKAGGKNKKSPIIAQVHVVANIFKFSK